MHSRPTVGLNFLIGLIEGFSGRNSLYKLIIMNWMVIITKVKINFEAISHLKYEIAKHQSRLLIVTR